MQKCTLHVSGTHCPSCKILIEDILQEEDSVLNPQMNLKTKKIVFETENVVNKEFIERLNEKVISHGYAFSNIETREEKNNDLLWQAIPIGLIFLILFLLLQKSGILNIGIGSTVTPVTAVMIGFIASLSSCLAVVGGLILSLSAKVANDTHDRKPFFLFHAGRIFGFALFGGLLGFLGNALGINSLFTSLLGLLSAIVMVLLGLNLLGILRKSIFTLPDKFFSFFRKAEHEIFAPLLLGAGTFFLPCGFTQSMQVAALSTGSPYSGSLIMFSFALGTLPVLSALSFGSASFARSRYAPLFFRITGVVVLGFWILALLTGLAALGMIPPIITI